MFKQLASVLGIGYVKGGGTVAAAACGLALYLARTKGATHRPWPAAGLTLALLAGGTLAAERVEPAWGKDSSRVVIDEVAGMWVSLLGLPVTGPRVLAGLALFRFFDITKLFFITDMERLPGGPGVMLDDVLAGIYSNLLLRTAVRQGYL